MPDAHAIDEALVDSFRRDGCAVISGVFAPWIEGARVGVTQNMAAPSFRERTYRPEDGSPPSSRTSATGIASPAIGRWLSIRRWPGSPRA